MTYRSSCAFTQHLFPPPPPPPQWSFVSGMWQKTDFIVLPHITYRGGGCEFISSCNLYWVHLMAAFLFYSVHCPFNSNRFVEVPIARNKNRIVNDDNVWASRVTFCNPPTAFLIRRFSHAVRDLNALQCADMPQNQFA